MENELLDLEKRYNVIIDKYCIMPNHIHLIIFINGLNREEQSLSPTISDIICTFKSITTKKINLFEKVKARQSWQRSFLTILFVMNKIYLMSVGILKKIQ